jgi:hypothetical protein
MMSHMAHKTTDHTMLERFAADTIDTLTCGGLALSAPFRATRCNSDMRMHEYIADLEKLRSCKRKGPGQAPGPSHSPMLKTDNALVPQSFQKETGPKPRALQEKNPSLG